MHAITLTHSIDAAHRVVGHAGKCARLHGHTYGFDVTVESRELTPLGFVCDFATIKEELNQWDHQTILWDADPIHVALPVDDSARTMEDYAEAEYEAGVIRVSFNPTAEAMATAACQALAYRIQEENPTLLRVAVGVAETAKSVAYAELVVAPVPIEVRKP